MVSMKSIHIITCTCTLSLFLSLPPSLPPSLSLSLPPSLSLGAAVVFTDLERGAVAVIKSMGRESSKTVGHKYGEDAGKVADESMTAAAHGINLAYVRIL